MATKFTSAGGPAPSWIANLWSPSQCHGLLWGLRQGGVAAGVLVWRSPRATWQLAKTRVVEVTAGISPGTLPSPTSHGSRLKPSIASDRGSKMGKTHVCSRNQTWSMSHRSPAWACHQCVGFWRSDAAQGQGHRELVVDGAEIEAPTPHVLVCRVDGPPLPLERLGSGTEAIWHRSLSSVGACLAITAGGLPWGSDVPADRAPENLGQVSGDE